MADNLTQEQRRKAMQAVKGKNTSLETRVAEAFVAQGWLFEQHCSSMPKKPDFVSSESRVFDFVFVDGDFWHGWLYPQWTIKLSQFWQKKIERTRRRRNVNSHCEWRLSVSKGFAMNQSFVTEPFSTVSESLDKRFC